MLAGGEVDALLAEPLVGIPAAGLRNVHSAGHVRAIDLEAERRRAARVVIRRPDADVVATGCRHVHRVGEPLSGLDVVYGEAAAMRVARSGDVDVFRSAVLAAGVTRREVVVGDPFTAFVEVRRGEYERQSDRRPAVRRAGRGTTDRATARGRRPARKHAEGAHVEVLR